MNEKNLKEEIEKSVGLRVKKYRTLKRITQEKLSEMLEVSPTFIAMIETGKTGMSLETLVKLSKALSVTPNDILQDHVKLYRDDELSEYIYNQVSGMSEKDKRLMLKISEHIISEK